MLNSLPAEVLAESLVEVVVLGMMSPIVRR